jgi:hypothetical protein
MKVSECPACGAPIRPGTDQCPYCGQYFERQHTVEQGAERGKNLSGGGLPTNGLIFQRKTEPNEGAFSLSVPEGWLLEGGIYRADLVHQVIDAQSIGPKLDFTVKRDSAGSVLIRWGPEIKYCDLSSTPAGMMGMFPPGSNYQGMMVTPLMPAEVFLVQVVLPWAHPQASQVQVVAQRKEPLLVDGYRRRVEMLGSAFNFEYDAGMILVSYTEGGTRYEEKAQTVIENMGPMAGGMWSNKDTVLMRAPEGELETWEPVLQHIRESVQITPQWLAQEIVNQEFLTRSFLNAQQASMARDRRMLEVQQQLQQMDRQIVEHRQRTNAEIQNDAYLTLMDLEEYVNPYTSEVDVGSNQWQHRWVNENGDEYYTDREYDDPNTPGILNRTDWKRTPIRPRFPQ